MNNSECFTIFIKLNDTKMQQDGINIISCYEDIENIAYRYNGHVIENYGYEFTDPIYRELFSSILQHKEWFMKYVSCWKWDIDDPDDSFIRIAREHGEHIAYA